MNERLATLSYLKKLVEERAVRLAAPDISVVTRHRLNSEVTELSKVIDLVLKAQS